MVYPADQSFWLWLSARDEHYLALTGDYFDDE